ncbi:MAG: hypothetical protein Q4A65_09325 [Bacillota bacterium]|nr:hypothetical protein [Bacillota bacterium]
MAYQNNTPYMTVGDLVHLDPTLMRAGQSGAADIWTNIKAYLGKAAEAFSGKNEEEQ